MPTLPDFDPSNLPPYPEKPHKTGQARVNVAGKSQYLGKYGTLESHALYHLACVRKLVTGGVPTTRELRNEVATMAGAPGRPTTYPAVAPVVALLLAVAVTSGVLSHIVTKASVRHLPSQQVVTHKPVLTIDANSDVGDSGVSGDNQRPRLDNATSQVVRETSAAFPNASISDALSFAAERFKFHRERSHANAKQMEDGVSEAGH